MAPGLIARLAASGIAYQEKNHDSKLFGKSQRVGGAYNRCGLCVSRCPVANIELADTKGYFKHFHCYFEDDTM